MTVDEPKTFREKISETGRQYSLIIFHLFIAIAAFIAAAIYVNILIEQRPPSIELLTERVSEEYFIISFINVSIAVFATYFPLVVAIWVGLTFAGRANALMRAAFYEQTSVIPAKDYDLVKVAIEKGDPAPITEYIRLVSLTGGVGVFQKVGLTGLPLITLGLVLFFALGVMFLPSESKTFEAFLDFTKLTLGAFIGSFVQRQVENRSRETELQRAVENVVRRPEGGGAPPPRPPETPPGDRDSSSMPPATTPEPPSEGGSAVSPSRPPETPPVAGTTVPPAQTSQTPPSGVVVPPSPPSGTPPETSGAAPSVVTSETAPSAGGSVPPEKIRDTSPIAERIAPLSRRPEARPAADEIEPPPSPPGIPIAGDDVAPLPRTPETSPKAGEVEPPSPPRMPIAGDEVAPLPRTPETPPATDGVEQPPSPAGTPIAGDEIAPPSRTPETPSPDSTGRARPNRD
jgi:hypothetical protein